VLEAMDRLRRRGAGDAETTLVNRPWGEGPVKRGGQVPYCCGCQAFDPIRVAGLAPPYDVDASGLRTGRVLER